MAGAIGPQVNRVSILLSQEDTVLEDIIVVAHAFPALKHLGISDLRFFDDESDEDSDGDLQSDVSLALRVSLRCHSLLTQDFTTAVSNGNAVTTINDRNCPPTFPELEWLGLGQLSLVPRIFGPDRASGFEVLLAGLTRATCPMLQRIDILQYVGPLDTFLSRYDGVCPRRCSIRMYRR